MRRVKVIFGGAGKCAKPLKDFLELDKAMRRDALKRIKKFVLNEPQRNRYSVQMDGVL